MNQPHQIQPEYIGNVQEKTRLLKEKFTETYKIRNKNQHKLAEELLSNIGKIDWKSEGYTTPENQRDLSIKFHWGHDHTFADDLKVKGRMGERHLQLIAEFLTGFNLPNNFFNERKVLDVGCWTGGTTLTLKMLGAEKILALEEVRKYSDAANTLFKKIYKLDNTVCEPTSLYMFDKSDFDLVYFPGVVYHLSDPVLGLRRLFNALIDGGEILVESHGLNSPKPICLYEGNRIFHTKNNKNLTRRGWNWFIPSPSCLSRWILEAGFDDVKAYFSPVSKRVFAYGKRTCFREITRAGLSVPDIL